MDSRSLFATRPNLGWIGLALVVGLGVLLILNPMTHLASAPVYSQATTPTAAPALTPCPPVQSITLRPHLILNPTQQASEVDALVTVAWDTDGLWLAVINNDGVLIEDGVQIYDARTGQRVYEERDDGLTVGAWSPDRPLLALGTEGGSINYWSPNRDEENSRRLVFNAEIGQQALYGLNWFQDGQHLLVASTGSALYRVNVASGIVQAVYDIQNREGVPIVAALSPDENLIATSQDDYGVAVYERVTGARVHYWPGGGQLVRRLVWSPDGRYLSVVNGSANFQVRDVQTGEPVHFDVTVEARGLYDWAWSPDGRLVAAATTQLHILSAEDGTLLTTERGQNVPVLGVGWSPDGQYLGVYTALQAVTIYEVQRNPGNTAGC